MVAFLCVCWVKKRHVVDSLHTDVT